MRFGQKKLNIKCVFLTRGVNVIFRGVLGDLCTPKNAEFFSTYTVQIS
jgi:hypothetical protein